ncbi:Hpt domain-containing protein [Alkalispirochaeta americana]|nr:Hpt domain-containing protein [Alkalispirochaeta americana]
MSDESSLLVFDYEGFFVRVMADQELARMIASAFLQDTPGLIQKMVEALERDDYETILRQAHTIKGASANVGGQVLCYVAQELEHSARKARHDDCVTALCELQDAWTALDKEIRKNLDLS